MAERLKVLAWKASEDVNPPQVRILSSPLCSGEGELILI